MAKSSEPLWWLLFAAGGTVAALLMPVHIVLGLVVALGGLREAFAYERIISLVTHPLGRLYLFVLIALSLFHWAHRFRYTLAEGLHLKASWLPVSVGCYGSAILGTLLAILALMRL